LALAGDCKRAGTARSRERSLRGRVNLRCPATVSDSIASCKSILARIVRQISPLEMAFIRRASTFDDLYYPFSGTPLDRPTRRHSAGRRAYP